MFGEHSGPTALGIACTSEICPAPPTWSYRSIGLPYSFTDASGTSMAARDPSVQLPIGSFGTRNLMPTLAGTLGTEPGLRIEDGR